VWLHPSSIRAGALAAHCGRLDVVQTLVFNRHMTGFMQSRTRNEKLPQTLFRSGTRAFVFDKVQAAP
jgi:hypothetical protein